LFFKSLDHSYLVKSSRADLSVENIWRTYVLPNRVASAFRAMGSPCGNNRSSTISGAGAKQSCCLSSEKWSAEGPTIICRRWSKATEIKNDLNGLDDTHRVPSGRR
jgi:hypothetical protein